MSTSNSFLSSSQCLALLEAWPPAPSSSSIRHHAVRTLLRADVGWIQAPAYANVDDETKPPVALFVRVVAPSEQLVVRAVVKLPINVELASAVVTDVARRKEWDNNVEDVDPVEIVDPFTLVLRSRVSLSAAHSSLDQLYEESSYFEEVPLTPSAAGHNEGETLVTSFSVLHSTFPDLAEQSNHASLSASHVINNTPPALTPAQTKNAVNGRARRIYSGFWFYPDMEEANHCICTFVLSVDPRNTLKITNPAHADAKAPPVSLAQNYAYNMLTALHAFVSKPDVQEWAAVIAEGRRANREALNENGSATNIPSAVEVAVQKEEEKKKKEQEEKERREKEGDNSSPQVEELEEWDDLAIAREGRGRSTAVSISIKPNNAPPANVEPYRLTFQDGEWAIIDECKYDSVLKQAYGTALAAVEAQGSTDGWVYNSTQQEVNIYLKKVPGSTTDQCKGVGIIDFPPEVVLNLFNNPAHRHEWDEMFDKGERADCLDSFTVINYTSFKAPWPVAGRDFLAVARTLVRPDGGLFSFSVSIEHPKYPAKKPLVRGSLHYCGLLVRPVKGDMNRSEVIYSLGSDPNGSIPKSLVNAANVKQPLVISVIRKTLKEKVNLRQSVEESVAQEIQSRKEWRQNQKAAAAAAAAALAAPAATTAAAVPTSADAASSTTSTAVASSSVNSTSPSASEKKSSESGLEDISEEGTEESTDAVLDLDDPMLGITLSTKYDILLNKAKAQAEAAVNAKGETDGWVFNSRQQEIDIYMRKLPGSTVEQSKGVGRVDGIRPEVVYAVFTDFGVRNGWDEMFDQGYIIEQVDDVTDISYSSFKAPWPVSSREFVAIGRGICTKDTFFRWSTSIETSHCAKAPAQPKKGHIRGTLHYSALQVKKLGDLSCEITYIVASDPNGSIPKGIVNAANVKQPLCISNIMKYLLAHPEVVKQVDDKLKRKADERKRRVSTSGRIRSAGSIANSLSLATSSTVSALPQVVSAAREVLLSGPLDAWSVASNMLLIPYEPELPPECKIDQPETFISKFLLILSFFLSMFKDFITVSFLRLSEAPAPPTLENPPDYVAGHLYLSFLHLKQLVASVQSPHVTDGISRYTIHASLEAQHFECTATIDSQGRFAVEPQHVLFKVYNPHASLLVSVYGEELILPTQEVKTSFLDSALDKFVHNFKDKKDKEKEKDKDSKKGSISASSPSNSSSSFSPSSSSQSSHVLLSQASFSLSQLGCIPNHSRVAWYPFHSAQLRIQNQASHGLLILSHFSRASPLVDFLVEFQPRFPAAYDNLYHLCCYSAGDFQHLALTSRAAAEYAYNRLDANDPRMLIYQGHVLHCWSKNEDLRKQLFAFFANLLRPELTKVVQSSFSEITGVKTRSRSSAVLLTPPSPSSSSLSLPESASTASLIASPPFSPPAFVNNIYRVASAATPCIELARFCYNVFKWEDVYLSFTVLLLFLLCCFHPQYTITLFSAALLWYIALQGANIHFERVLMGSEAWTQKQAAKQEQVNSLISSLRREEMNLSSNTRNAFIAFQAQIGKVAAFLEDFTGLLQWRDDEKTMQLVALAIWCLFTSLLLPFSGFLFCTLLLICLHRSPAAHGVLWLIARVLLFGRRQFYWRDMKKTPKNSTIQTY